MNDTDRSEFSFSLNSTLFWSEFLINHWTDFCADFLKNLMEILMRRSFVLLLVLSYDLKKKVYKVQFFLKI